MTGNIFDIQRFSLGNGPGIRTTVFLKGCPLRCQWCHNPESFSPMPQLMIDTVLCRHCGRCADVCPNGALIFENGMPRHSPEQCILCRKCTEACCYGVLRIVGRSIDDETLAETLLRDRLYFENSGGGVTFSGGEPTMQSDFVIAVASRLRREGIHIAVDTCGHCAPDRFQAILESTDLVLFDIKHVDTEAHKALTGVGNDMILKNLELAEQSGKELVIRFPMIPGKNDSEEHLAAMAGLLLSRGIDSLEISVYHDYGTAKYHGLGLEPTRIASATDEETEEKRSTLARLGMRTALI